MFASAVRTGNITHTIANGQCTECGDTVEWFQRTGEPYVMTTGKA